MKLSIVSTLLALAMTVSSAPSVTLGFEKRDPAGSFKLVAYGIAPSAIDFFYSDGMIQLIHPPLSSPLLRLGNYTLIHY